MQGGVHKLRNVIFWRREEFVEAFEKLKNFQSA